eukprot:g18178.t1
MHPFAPYCTRAELIEHLEQLEYEYHVYGPPTEIETWDPNPRSDSDTDEDYSSDEEGPAVAEDPAVLYRNVLGEILETVPRKPHIDMSNTHAMEQVGGSSSSSSMRRQHILLDVDGVIDEEEDHVITVPDMARAFLAPHHPNAGKLLHELIKKGFCDHVSFK